MSNDPYSKNSLIDSTTLSSAALRIKHHINTRFPDLFSKPFFAITALIVVVILVFPYTFEVQIFDLPMVGEVAKETIIAPFTFDIVKSIPDLERERSKAIRDVLIVLDYDSNAVKKSRQKFLDLRTAIYSINNKQMNDSNRVSLIRSLRKELSENTVLALIRRPYLLDDGLFQAEKALTKGILSVLLVPSVQKLNELRDEYNAPFQRYLLYNNEFAVVRRNSKELTTGLSTLPVKEIALDNSIQTLKTKRMFDQEALNSLYELLYAYILPNVTINGEATRERERQASMEVLPIKGKVIKDTEIVRKHQEVTQEILEKLLSLRHALALRKQGGDTLRILLTNAGKVALVTITLILLFIFILVFQPSVFSNPKHVLALICIIILQISIIRIGLIIAPKIFEGANELNSAGSAYLVPIAFASMLTAILFNLQLSFIVSIFSAVFFAVVLGFNQAFFMFALFGGLVTGLSARKIRYRGDFFRAIPPVILVYCIFIGLWDMINFNFSSLTINCGLAAINCILTTFFAMMFVAIFETLFDLTTDMTLIELSDMNHPLLKRLSIEAAGTYNHSVLVANLAESAAAQIDANPLLARIAAYYHDIGKLNKPNYFIENQKAERNIHHKLSPSMSALIISSHVKDGLDLAKKYNLPQVIRDTISQHHGTSAVSFFYEKALEQDPHKQVQEKDFCYPGPRPRSKENAIIMLADSVEAASRSLATSSPKLLRDLVKKIIHDKFSSSQLDECNLTFQNLDAIINGFMPVLQGIFHTRIKYPSR
jgi:putative nucleotidyltransferase with HDIG domain